MANEEKRNPLITEEDWWTVWFGLTILLVATVLGIMTFSDSISAKKVPKLGKWISSPVDAFYHAKKPGSVSTNPRHWRSWLIG